MTASAARDIRNVPLTLTVMSRSKSASPVVSAVPVVPTPALFTRMSSGPKAASVARTALSQSAGCDTSHATASARPSSAAISADTASAFGWRRSATATAAPSRAKASAVARPMPEPAPVTITTFPRKRSLKPSPQAAEAAIGVAVIV